MSEMFQPSAPKPAAAKTHAPVANGPVVVDQCEIKPVSVSYEDGCVVVRLPLYEEPTYSNSLRTKYVLGTNGRLNTTLRIAGKPLTIDVKGWTPA